VRPRIASPNRAPAQEVPPVAEVVSCWSSVVSRPRHGGRRTRHLVAPLHRCLVAYQDTSAFLNRSLSSHPQHCQSRVCKNKVWHASAGAAAKAFLSAAPGSVWQPLAMLISSGCAPADRFAGSVEAVCNRSTGHKPVPQATGPTGKHAGVSEDPGVDAGARKRI
jgi:hypothetical protein